MRKPFDRRTPRWWAISIAIHVVLVAVLAQIVFKYPLGQLVGIPRHNTAQERLQYITLPQPTESSAGGGATAPSPEAAPAELRAPIAVPAQVPVPVAADSARAQAAGGTGAGDGGGGGMATGIAPRLPDPRIALSPDAISRVPRTVAEDVDSIVNLVIGIVRDSLAIAAGERKPGDWTMKGKDGEVWGWDPNGNIRLGKFTIPGALLALLPLNKLGSPRDPIEARSLAYIRRDIMEHAQQAINEDEFRAAVKRIRERKERERLQQQLAERKAGEP